MDSLSLMLRKALVFIYNSIVIHNPESVISIEFNLQTNRVNGRLCGLILRSQLIVILKRKYFEECKRHWEDRVSIEDFRSEYPRYPSIDVSSKSARQKSQICLLIFQYIIAEGEN